MFILASHNVYSRVAAAGMCTQCLFYACSAISAAVVLLVFSSLPGKGAPTLVLSLLVMVEYAWRLFARRREPVVPVTEWVTSKGSSSSSGLVDVGSGGSGRQGT